MKKIMIIIVTTGMVMFSGCASQKEVMLQEGHSLVYAEGFDDGCHSGKKAGGNMFESFKKDENLFAKHGKYAQGWSDGFRQCESEQEAMDRKIRINIEQQQLIEVQKHNKKMGNYYLEGIKYDPKILNQLK